MKGHQNTKTFLRKVTLQIDLKKFLRLKKLKNTVPWTNICELNGEIVGPFYEKELQKTNQTEFRVEKAVKKKKW